MWQERDQIVQQPIASALKSVALPAVGSSLFYVVFEIVDMFWVGKLGAVPVAALSAASFFVWMLRALAQTVATGVLAFISRRVGENDSEGFLDTAVHAITATFVFAVLMIAVLFPFAKPLYHWIRLDPQVASLAAEYAVVFLSGLVFVYMMVTVEHILRGTGDTRTPMIIIGFSLFLNAGLDPVFIFVLNMGLKGAAVATILAHSVGCLVMLGFLLKRYPEIRRRKPSMRPTFMKRQFLPMMKIGAPIAFSGASFSVIYLFLSGIISIFGSAPLAAIGIGHRLEAFPFFVAFGFSMATATMVGQNLGAGNPKKAKQSALVTLGISSAILLLVSVIFFIYAENLYRFFISDPEVIRQGAHYLRIIAVFEVFLASEVVLEGAFSGAGDTRPPFLVVFPLTFLRIPFSYLFAVTLGFGVIAIWAVISVSTLLKGIVLFAWFMKDGWMRKQI